MPVRLSVPIQVSLNYFQHLVSELDQAASAAEKTKTIASMIRFINQNIGGSLADFENQATAIRISVINTAPQYLEQLKARNESLAGEISKIAELVQQRDFLSVLVDLVEKIETNSPSEVDLATDLRDELLALEEEASLASDRLRYAVEIEIPQILGVLEENNQQINARISASPSLSALETLGGDQ